MLRLLSLSGLLLFAGCLHADEQKFVVVKDRRPQAVIVVSPHASPQVRNAATILQSYIRKSTNAKLPIELRTKPGPGTCIYVGHNDALGPFELKSLDEDGFVFKGFDSGNLAIIGGSDWGTEFGVYAFLEEYFGVRWLMPTELGEVVPKHEDLVVTLASGETRHEPAFLSRQLSPLTIDPAKSPLGQWGRFNRARGRIAFHHNMTRLFPISKFGKTNPEFYPLINGERKVPDVKSYIWNPNFSAPGIVDAAVEQIESYFKANPDKISYSLGMNDSQLYDQSPQSLARRSGKLNSLGVEDVSDDYFQWANEVVERVAKTYPDKWFGLLAYLCNFDPPTRVKVNPRLIPFICFERLRWNDPEVRAKDQANTERWGKVASTMGWYDYAYGSNYLLPRVWPHLMQVYLSWAKKAGVDYYYAELYPNFGTGPNSWVLTRLLWNPDQDVDGLLDDWYRSAAGEEAAPFLRRYFEIWEHFWTEEIYSSSWYRASDQFLPFFSVPPDYLLDVKDTSIAQSDEALAAALDAAGTPEEKLRVARLQEMWQFYKASILLYRAEKLASDSGPVTEKEALKLLDKIFAATPDSIAYQAKLRRELAEKFATDPLFSDALKNITSYPNTSGGDWGMSLLSKVMETARESRVVRQRLDAVAKDYPEVNGLLCALDGKGVLRSKDPSFSQGEGAVWSFWDKHGEDAARYAKGVWLVQTGISRSGKSGLMVKGLGRGAAKQSVGLEPGRYYVTASAYVKAPLEKGTATLQVQQFGAGNRLAGGLALPSRKLSLRPGQWTTTTMFMQIPEGKKQVVSLSVLMDSFSPADCIYLDDVAIYRVQD